MSDYDRLFFIAICIFGLGIYFVVSMAAILR